MKATAGERAAVAEQRFSRMPAVRSNQPAALDGRAGSNV
jgi:hypothetical protein